MMGDVVYFIGSENGPIKIGTTTGDVGGRLRLLQTGHPEKLSLLGVCPGGARVESTFHVIFAKQRLHGEWFERSDELMRLIAAHSDPLERPKEERSPRSPPGTFDRTAYQRELMRKRRAAEKSRQGERPRGRPRIEEKDNTNEARKPWVKAGMSRATWYRRQKEAREK